MQMPSLKQPAYLSKRANFTTEQSSEALDYFNADIFISQQPEDGEIDF